jgi:eukaryotic-like serine/threonine-protein kinase
VLLVILLAPTNLLLCRSQLVAESTYATPLSTNATSYGDIMQYPWAQAGGDEGRTGSNNGPAPEKADVLWKVATSANSIVSVFNGKAFATSGTTVMAFDALTGASLYNSTAPGTDSAAGVEAISKLDETYFLTNGNGGMTVRRIADGQLVWNMSTPNANRNPGSGTYFGGHYSTSMKMYFNHAYDIVKHQAQIVAVDVSNPAVPQTQPTWIWACDMASEILCSGEGRLYLGTTEGEVYALNATGQRVWQSPTWGGLVQQAAMYYEHKLYTSAVTWQMTCFDGATGQKIWQTQKGIRAFTAYHGACGAGMIFDATDDVDPYGSIGAWDAATGVRLWKQPAYFNIHYDTMAYADGKVYGIKCDRAAGTVTAGLTMPGISTTCWDAYTGTELWNLPDISFTYPSVAYGNLYGISGGYLYCIGGNPKDWNYGFVGNINQPRVAVGQQGPADISTPRWVYHTDGDVFSSPAVVGGKVYVGSADKNLYCLDAYTGQQLWNFTIGHYLRSSPAVTGGRVYIGPDDGYIYAIDANTGAQIWKTSAGGFFPTLLDVNEADARSSPIVVGSSLYVGALDNKLYCLNLDGTVQWTYTTGGPIYGSPGYYNNIVYITSTDGYLYAVNAYGGSLAWKSAFTLNLDVGMPAFSEHYNIGSPTIINGVLYVGGGVQYGIALYSDSWYAARGQSTPSSNGIRMFAFNASTGASVWNQSRAGNTQPIYYPCVFNGNIYAPEFFEVTSMSATKPNSTGTVNPVPDFSQTGRRAGNRTWSTWVGYQIQGSLTYADDLTGAKIYVGSDIGSIYVLNASSGKTYSVFTAGGNVPCSPTVWEGKLYIGTTEGKLYCFDDSPTVDFNLYATASKGGEMWNNETITIAGQLTSNPMMKEWDYSSLSYQSVTSQYHPGLPNASIQVSLTKPDGSTVTLNATTGTDGKFSISYIPTEIGQWGWVSYYEGKRTTGLQYNSAYSQWNQINVAQAPFEATPEPTATPTPTPEITVTPTPTEVPTATPTAAPVSGTVETAYLIIAVVVIIVVIAVAAFVAKKRKKKPKA